MAKLKNPRLRKWRLAPGQVPIRLRLLLGFTVPLAAWILVSVLNITVWNRAFENGERLFDSQLTILLANEYISASLRVQAAQRGFLVTSDPEFLVPYREARNAVNRIHGDLTELVRSNPEQLKLLQDAGEKFQQWLYDVSWKRIEARRRLPLDIVEAMHELEKKLLALQNAHMRGTPGDSGPQKLLAELRAETHRLAQHETLRDHRSTLEQALRNLDDYEAGLEQGNAQQSSRALRDFIAMLTRTIQLVLDADRRIKFVIAEDTRHSVLDEFQHRIDRFITFEKVLLAGYRQEMEKADQRGRLILWAGPALGLLMMIIVTGWMSRRIALSLEGISLAARGLARGDLGARADVRGKDEFAVLAERFNDMAELVEARSRESAALAELGELLQSSTSIEEAARIFARLAARLMPDKPGALYLMAPSRDEVVAVAFWNNGADYSKAEFAPEDCWALRLSRVHENNGGDVRCAHITDHECHCVCLPLHAFGESLGILCVADPAGGFMEGSIGAEQHREFLETVSEHLALALANLRLRETLRHQSIRDPLTQLYNRRYLDETFRRELHRVARHGLPLSLLTFDIDNFKRYNDTHGHDAGDVLLKTVGHSLREFFRAEDGAFRSGGEEFIAVLPETTLDDALSRAEELRREVASLEVQHGNILLPPITISIGVAAFPEHGNTTDQLLKAADSALYKAKANGRNRVEVAD